MSPTGGSLCVFAQADGFEMARIARSVATGPQWEPRRGDWRGDGWFVEPGTGRLALEFEFGEPFGDEELAA